MRLIIDLGNCKKSTTCRAFNHFSVQLSDKKWEIPGMEKRIKNGVPKKMMQFAAFKFSLCDYLQHACDFFELAKGEPIVQRPEPEKLIKFS
jgi:hypothetical protein